MESMQIKELVMESEDMRVLQKLWKPDVDNNAKISCPIVVILGHHMDRVFSLAGDSSFASFGFHWLVNLGSSVTEI